MDITFRFSKQENKSSESDRDVEKAQQNSNISSANEASNNESNLGPTGIADTNEIPTAPSLLESSDSQPILHLNEATKSFIVHQIKTELKVVGEINCSMIEQIIKTELKKESEVAKQEGAKLSEDTYSMMKITKNWQSYLLSLLVWFIQMALYVFVLWELIDRPEVFGTEFNIPFRTSNTTSVGQFIAILFAIAELPDLIMWSGVKSKDNNEKTHIFVPNLLQLVMGLSAMLVSCILILQSKDIIEVFGNFAAMNIIAQFDDVVYTFCSIGFCGDTPKKDAKVVQSSYKDVGTESGCRRFIVLYFLLAIMPFGMGFVFYKQSANTYFEQKYPSCSVPQGNDISLKNFGDGICDTSRAIMNNYQCNFEGGDCATFNTAYPDCNASSPKDVGDNNCDDELNHESCGWDGGDCCPYKLKNEKYYGDGICHAIFNTAKCLYDKGDCLSLNMKYENFKVPETTAAFDLDDDDRLPIRLGEGKCSLDKEYMVEYMNEESGWVFGDCVDKVDINNTKRSDYEDCRQQDLFKIGNGKCDENFLTDSCGWDELDCCELDKAKVNDGQCDKEYLTKECGYDGYDCCTKFLKDKYLKNEICDDSVTFVEYSGMTGGRDFYDDFDYEFRGGLQFRFYLKEIDECGNDNFDCEQVEVPGFDGCVVPDHQLLGNGECDGGDYNTENCKWDGGDCDEHNRVYPNCQLSDMSTFSDGKCHHGEPGYIFSSGILNSKQNTNSMECGYDGGDCIEFNAKYPNCHVPHPYRVGDGFCHQHFNHSDCDFDGGDCIGVEKEFNRKYPDCKVPDPSLIGDGKCNRREKFAPAETDIFYTVQTPNMEEYGWFDYNTKECGWDGGDCLSSNAEYSTKGTCSETQIAKVENGECDEESNVYHCKWDGGDCLREIGCEFENNELDLIGDGHCDEQFNTSECHFDKGDCE